MDYCGAESGNRKDRVIEKESLCIIEPSPSKTHQQVQENESQRNKGTIVWLPLETSGGLFTSIIISKFLSTFMCSLGLTCTHLTSLQYQILQQASYWVTFGPLDQWRLCNRADDNLGAIFDYLWDYSGNSSFPIYFYHVRTLLEWHESNLVFWSDYKYPHILFFATLLSASWFSYKHVYLQ